MKFCKECKSIMSIKDNFFRCTSCDFEEEILEGDLVIKEKIPKKPEVKQGIVKKQNIFATYDLFKCKKCGYKRAEVIERQPYISDEDTLTFLKCGKCGFTQQLARKIG